MDLGYIVNVVMNRSCRLQKVGVGLVVGLACLFACTIAKAVSSVSLEWSPNTDPSVAGYNVYYGRASGDYARLVTVTKPTAMIAVKGSRTLYFAVTAYDTSGLESELSEEVHWP